MGITIEDNEYINTSVATGSQSRGDSDSNMMLRIAPRALLLLCLAAVAVALPVENSERKYFPLALACLN